MAAGRPLTYTPIFETVRGVGNLLAPDDFKYSTEIPAGTPESRIIIHLSCMASYTPHIPMIAQHILERLGHDAMIVGGPENCCGEFHKHLEDSELEKQTARIALFAFRKAKPKKVFSICPDCDDQFRKHGVSRQPYEQHNISSLFVQMLDEIRPKLKPVNMRIIPHYHTLNEFRRSDADNMMTILRAIPGLEILDAAHALGPGNHCQTLHPMPPVDQARMFEEARDLKADAVVVPYHSCYRQHCKLELTYGVTTHHMFSILAMALGVPFTEPFKEIRLLGTVDAAFEALKPKIEKFGYDEKLARAQITKAIFC
jgi:hypothetical protein